MKFKANSKLDTVYFGIIISLVIAFIITSIIITSRSEDFGLLYHYQHMFDDDQIGSILRSRVMLSVKGGAIVNLFIFYLFLNRKMMKAVRGTVGVVVVLALIIALGYILK